MYEILTSTIAQTVGWSLVHFLWQGALIAAIARVVLWMCTAHQSNLRYVISCAAMCLMLLCPIVTTLYLLPAQTQLTSTRIADLNRPTSPPVLPGPREPVFESTGSPQPDSAQLHTPVPTPEPSPTLNGHVEPNPPSWLQSFPNYLSERIELILPFAMGVWAMGVLILSSRLFYGWCGVQRLRRSGKPVSDPKTIRTLRHIKETINLKIATPIRETISVHSPMVVGWLRPVILLPSSALTGLTPEQLSSILAHELAHIRRADYLVNLLQSAIEILLFYHPAVWWLSGQIRKERENCCDDLAIQICQDKKLYVEALMKLEQSRDLSNQLGMASDGGNLVERVARLLGRNGTRPRRTSWIAAVIATLVVSSLVYVATSERSVAKELNAEEVDHQDTDKPAEKNLEKMRVQVLRPDKTPIVGAKLLVCIWYQETAGTENHVTDNDGFIEIRLPEDYRIIRIWAVAEGYANMFANWEELEIKSGGLPPNEFVFPMIPAVEVGGTVVDEQGTPIEGVSVEVKRVSNPEDNSQRIKYGTWLAQGTDARITDEKGRWTLDNVPPGDDIQLELKLTHPDYISDDNWGDIQKTQSIAQKDLRDQTAGIVLNKGIQVAGTITGPDGKPVDNALIVWGDTPYFQSGSQEIAVENDGTYQTPTQKNGKLRITVIAPGYAPQTTLVDIGPDLEDVDFSLEPGNKLEIQFVDTDGNPVPDVYAGIQQWRRSKALYNNQHPDVANTRIPTKSNRVGLYTWDWAPEDTITWSFFARGFSAVPEVDLAASDEPHTIVLNRPTKFTGRVTDTAGKPIASFRVTPQRHFNDRISLRNSDMVRGKDGQFEIEIKSQAGQYSLRIEAEGYEPAITKSFDRDAACDPFQMTMKKSKATLVHVVDENGQAVKDATVVIAPSDQTIDLNNYLRQMSFRQGENTKTNQSGNFILNSSTTPRSLIVISDRGLGETSAYPGQPVDDIVVKDWAQVEGQIRARGEPWQARYFVKSNRYLDGHLFHVQMNWSGSTDGNGQFQVPRIAALPSTISFFNLDAPNRNRCNIAFDPQGGKTSKIDFANPIAINANIQLSGDNQDKVDLTKSRFSLRSNSPVIPLPPDLLKVIQSLGLDEQNYDEVSGHFQHVENWPANMSYSACFDQYSGTLDENGDLMIGVLRPGTYTLTISAIAESDSKVSGAIMSDFTRTVNVGQEPVELGQIDVAVFEDPSPGLEVPDVEITNLADKSKTNLSAFSGGYVLLDFWTPWCDLCERDTTKVHRLAKILARNGRTKMIALMSNGSGPVKRVPDSVPDGFTWIDGQLNYTTERQLRKQLGVWTSQHFVLIDPDGKYVFGGSFAAMAKHLDKLQLK